MVDGVITRTPTGAAPPATSHLGGRWLWRAYAVGLLIAFATRLAYVTSFDLAEGRTGRVAARVFDETTGIVLAAPLLAGLLWIARRWPLARPLRRGTAAVYAAAFGAFTVAHTTAMIAVRGALAPVFGLRGYAYAFTASRYAYEAANDVFPLVAILALVALAESVLAERARERRAAALERGLLRAELSNLRLQLQPHFLFNALNTISATMYEDVAAADAQLEQLAGLLRASLRTTHAHEVPARDELALLDQYLGLLRARFGDRLDATVRAGPEVAELLVPSMVLQPLVENAVRHGGVSRTGRGRVVVTLGHAAAPWGPALAVRVYDDGPPPNAAPAGDHALAGDATGGGTGLSTTARRLRLLYGDAHAMRAGPAAGGGFEVAFEIPARRADPDGRPPSAAHTTDSLGAPPVAAAGAPA
ncbi:hypothetical protein tb265_13810 [Gemmatimonadetes bacterium T265]|nr:hypothetical protein tb265_13810 [Gemmatimonadetes bacterium T265]